MLQIWTMDISPLLLPISGSQSLKLDHVSKFVPVKKIRTLLKCILLTNAFGSITDIDSFQT